LANISLCREKYKKIRLQKALPLVWAILFPSESDKVAVHTSKNVNEPPSGA